MELVDLKIVIPDNQLLFPVNYRKTTVFNKEAGIYRPGNESDRLWPISGILNTSK